MRTALSVVLTLWPPGPCERNTSIRRSFSSIFTSTSSASGSTATVAADVWMRPLRLGDGNALHPVDARFVPQRPVDTGAPCGEDGLLQAPEISLRERDDLDLPAPPLAEPRVHAKQRGGE